MRPCLKTANNENKREVQTELAQSAERLSSMHSGASLGSSTREVEEEGERVKFILNKIVSLRPAWVA